MSRNIVDSQKYCYVSVGVRIFDIQKFKIYWLNKVKFTQLYTILIFEIDHTRTSCLWLIGLQ